MNGRFMRSIALSLTLAVAAMVCYAATTGVISGTVTDPSGAVVPQASITVTNQGTGIKLTATSDAKGFYSFPALDVGTYTISASVTGFQSFQVTGIVIDANSNIRTDIQLKVGNVTQVTEVTANPVTIETQSTQVSQLIEGEQINAVPLNGRAFTDLLALQPSVSPYSGTSEGGKGTGLGGTVSGSLSPGNVSINGSREAANGFMVNGADVNYGVQNGAAIIPNLDSLSEFRIITSNYDAEYGNFNGGQVNVITKSGTNRFHGSVFEFLRNTDFNAANYYNKHVRNPYDQDIFGGTIGGPIKKDKVFFFGDIQGTKFSQATSAEPNVPSAADVEGNLIDQTNINGTNLLTGTVQGSNSPTGWQSVLSNRLGYTVTNGEPYYTPTCADTSQCVFPNAVIPTTAWDPVVSKVMKYIPNPNNLLGGVYVANLGGTPAVLYTSSPAKLSDYKESVRVDINTRFGTVFAYYFKDDDTLSSPFGGKSAPGFPTEGTNRAQLAVAGLTTTFKSNSVNSFRMSYVRNALHSGKPTYSLPGPSLSSLGFASPWSSATGGIGNISADLAGVPSISVQYGSAAASFGSATENGQYGNTFQFIDNFTKIVGTHTLQAGVDYHFDQVNDRNYTGVNGTFSFANSNETGSGWADFLLGAEAANFVQATEQILDSRSYYFGSYAEDSWRATPALTLNYGIRYEISTPWWDTQNKLETLIPGEQSIVFPGAPVGWVMPGDPGVPRTLADVKHNKFAPRFGFAWAPNTSGGFLDKLTGGNKLSVRGSAGLFYTSFQDETGFVEIGDPPYGLYWSTPWATQLSTPFVERSTQQITPAKFPFNWPPTNVSASNPDPNIPWSLLEPLSSDDAVNPKDTLPYSEEYSLSIQRQFGANTVLTLNYVGSQGRHLANSVEFNPGNIAECLTLNSSANVQAGTPTCGPKNESVEYYPTAASGLGTSPIFGTRILNPSNGQGLAFGKNPYLDTSATANYNALQANLRHSSNWGEVLLGYTWAKSMDDSSSQTGGTYVYNHQLSYGLSAFDVPQYLVASFNIHPPTPGWVTNGIAKAVVGGWAISGISKFAAGTPVAMTETDDRSLSGTSAGDQPNYSPTASIVGDHNPRDGKTWFNTSLFSKETLGVYGNTHPRFFVGPGLDHTDLSIQRNFPIEKLGTFNFRAEAFNIANHAEFANPTGSISSTSAFGKISTAVQSQRVLELVGKFTF